MPYLSHAADDEECIFDQQQQIIEYQKLLQKYPGSKYLQEENKLVIPDSDKEVHLSRGGCIHYGVTIESLEKNSGQTCNDKQFFQQIITLAAKYANNDVDTVKLNELIKQKHWDNMSTKDRKYFFLSYEGYTSFEIYQRYENKLIITGLSFYI